MIAFDLECINGHTFEGWFDDNAAYEEQKEKSLITCPVCNSADIIKKPSRFMIKSSESSGKSKFNPEKLQQKIVDFVNNHFEDVGCNFATEALKIHYGLSDSRNIRGVSSPEEEKILDKEGINYFKFPMPAPPKIDSEE